MPVKKDKEASEGPAPPAVPALDLIIFWEVGCFEFCGDRTIDAWGQNQTGQVHGQSNVFNVVTSTSLRSLLSSPAQPLAPPTRGGLGAVGPVKFTVEVRSVFLSHVSHTCFDWSERA